MLDYLGWSEAAQLIDTGITGALQAKEVTYDFARLMEGSTEVSCSEFGDRIIAHMTH
jgi:isocitrate dehydrogenase